MMQLSKIYEDFGEARQLSKPAANLNSEEIEDQKLDAFENGYQAGWDDAVKVHNETRAQINEALTESLRDLSFEYHQMRRDFSEAARSIVSEVIDKALPAMARATLGAHLKDLVTSHARKALDSGVELTIHPDVFAEMSDLLDDELSATVTLIEDNSLSSMQAMLRLGKQEHEVDLERTIKDMRESISTFFATQKSEVSNG